VYLTTPFRPNRLRVAAGLAAATTAAVSVVALWSVPAQAAAGDPFDVQSAKIFIAQGTPTALSTATTNGSGTVTFSPEGPDAGLTYNAVGFDESSGYIYGIAASSREAGNGVTAVEAGGLIRIGQNGVVTQVGTDTFGARHVGVAYQGFLYVNGGDTTLTAINMSTGEEDASRSQTLSDAPGVADLALSGGYFWGIKSDGTMTRIDPDNGDVDFFTTSATGSTPWAYGAAWTYGNGNLGFSNNPTGQVRQISIMNPGSANPGFEFVASSPGPTSTNNDGTAALGAPADLRIVKTGPAKAVAGLPISYTLTVTNNGPGSSSGYVVSDTVPAGLSNVASSDPACTVAGSTVTCVGGTLASGDTKAYTIAADVAASADGSLANSASVLGNEEDPTSSNNTSTFTTDVEEPDPDLTIIKKAELNDENGNDLADEGETIDYSFLVENTGNVDLTDVTVDDPKVSGLDPASADIKAGEDQTFTSDPYTVTDDDVEAGEVANTATASGTDPFDNSVEADGSSTTTETADPDDNGGGSGGSGGGDGNGLLPDTGAPAWMMTALAGAAAMMGSGAWLVRRRALPGRHSAE